MTASGKSCARREGGASPAWAAWPPTEGGSTPGSPSAQDSAAQGSTGEGSAAEAQRLLSAAATGAFRLNGAFLAVSEGIARTGGLTAARWQVLGSVLRTPAPVSEIARQLGLTRQAVQRTADALVAQGFAEYRPNPAHSRAKLLAATDAGVQAVRRIDPAHRALAERLAAELGPDGFRDAAAAVHALIGALERIGAERA
ncbi:MarR family winged helix-turn-helix transcriptional regulator [Nocardiopsis composta]|uniref:DNA-binding MarR family transcriptional regulator n=1 Tax=Nocardiopsis composta TaxID=157465 RepID=A0A7W8QR56_9ACTN|nr:MarR family winged helix-turn-helix transcriptional regulator [Nocardiopsis composta]MBB5434415.1 DNA-binding MarR family transcriptional regulator [Nocardiopsis composta]